MSEFTFTAEKTNFGGNGYIVRQYQGSQMVAEQFVEDEIYLEFCSLLGIEPDVIESKREEICKTIAIISED